MFGLTKRWRGLLPSTHSPSIPRLSFFLSIINGTLFAEESDAYSTRLSEIRCRGTEYLDLNYLEESEGTQRWIPTLSYSAAGALPTA